MKGIFSVLVENKSGVLAEISRLFARRAFNIDSLAVGETDRHDTSSMTIVSNGDQRTIDQIEKHLNKRIDVIKVRRLEEKQCIQQEMMLIKIAYNQSNRGSLIELCQIMHAEILHLSPKHVIVEIHSTSETLNEFIEMVRPYGISEIQRTGTIAIGKH